MPTAITIGNDQIRATIDPARGAGMYALQIQQRGQRLDLMPDCRAAGSDLTKTDPGGLPLTGCNWILAPYSNRIRDGRFTFNGTDYQLANEGKHAIHGDVRTRPWRIDDQSETHIACHLDSRDFPEFNWPWPIEMRVVYGVVNTVFSQRLWLWNRGESAMPAGLGFHPYYCRELTRPGEPVLLQMNYTGVYPDPDGTCLPAGTPEAPPDAINFSTEKPILPDSFFDCCTQGYDGRGAIRWPESGVTVEYACSEIFGHLVLFNPVGKPYFAVEPVSNANDGFNLLERGDPTSGVRTVNPGEVLEGRFDLIISTE